MKLKKNGLQNCRFILLDVNKRTRASDAVLFYRSLHQSISVRNNLVTTNKSWLLSFASAIQVTFIYENVRHEIYVQFITRLCTAVNIWQYRDA